jgi:hypothetical protein
MKRISYKFNTKNLNKIFNIDGEFIIEENFMTDSDGGCGGYKNGFYGKTHTEEVRKMIGERTKFLHETDENFRNSRINCGEKNGMYGSARFGELNPMYGKTHNEKTRKKISENIKKYYENNSNPNKGKKLSDEQKKIISEKNSKEYKLINPNGELIKIKNLTKFAKEHDLSIGCLQHVVAGRNKSHKGWKKYE